ncbi:hypothetical protein OEB99_06130 [Actinotalea sp. M2MS4P-6]|uniref:FtsX-like permease family protein n=1 Tax=Actinotalea sp. M2MS4P-6 TaxID=2983762 RepID=UPI0021E3B113|nr:FtsX-like permease family protein [Actinotalea sp. M2MS4P-6]MCV2393879.1 hypothetical protein [Actinotalea sp. M2MS4P-6]
MTFARLLRRRAGAQLGLLALAALLAGLVSATLVTVLGHVALAAQNGLVTALADAGPTGAATQFATPLAHDPAQQVAAAEEILDATLDGFPVVVQRSELSTPLTVDGHEVAVAAVPNLDALVTVVDGTLDAGEADPGGTDGAEPVAASLSSATAEALGVEVGDRLSLAGANPDAAPLEIEVAAVWEPVDAGDPRWFGEQDGAVWIGEADLDVVPATLRVRWTVVPDGELLSPGQIPALRTALDDTLTALKADDAVDELGVLATDGLDTTLAQIDRTLSTVRALSVPATLLAVLVGIVVLAQLAALLADVRRGELVLLRSRGASRARLVGAAAVEGLIVGAVGAALGSLLAAVALRGLGTVPVDLGIGAPAAVAAGVGAVLAGATWWRVRGPLREERADRPLRGSAVLGVVTLVLVAAGIGLWRLTDLGSPVRTVDGRAAPEPLATAALALGLLAVAVVVAAAVPPAARAASGLAARRRDLRVLAVQEIARRPTAHGAAAALVALAVATAVVVAFFLGSWQSLRTVRTAVSNGADLRLVADSRDVPDVLVAARTADPTATVVVADTRTATLGGVDALVVAVPRAAWPLLHRSPDDPAPADDAPAASDAPVPLPAGTGTLEVDLAVISAAAEDPALGSPQVAAWVRTDGVARRVELTPVASGTAPDRRTGTWRADVTGATDLVALDVRVAAEQPYRVELDSVEADGTPLTMPGHGALVGRTTRTLVGESGTTPTLHVPAEAVAPGTTVRFETLTDGALPVVATRALASALSLSIGDRTTATIPGHTLQIELTQVVEAVPGSTDPRSMLVDLDAWTATQLWTGTDVAAPHEIWAWAETAEGTAALAAALPGATSATPGPAPLLDPALTAFRVATWATVALAIGGVLAAARAGARARRPEIGVLRGIGVEGATQAGMRVAEHARVLAPAILGGAAAGTALAVVVTRPLVTALDAGTVPLPVVLEVDARALATWTVVVLVAVVTIVAGVARDTARRARTASPREVVP